MKKQQTLDLLEQLKIFNLIYDTVKIVDRYENLVYVLCKADSKTNLILLENYKESKHISDNAIEIGTCKTFICLAEKDTVKIIDKRNGKTIYETSIIDIKLGLLQRLKENTEENPFKDNIVIIEIIEDIQKVSRLIVKDTEEPKVLFHTRNKIYKKTTKTGEDIISIMEIDENWNLIKRKINKEGVVSNLENNELNFKTDEIETRAEKIVEIKARHEEYIINEYERL